MGLKGFISDKINKKLLKGCTIILLLTVLFFILRNMNLLQDQYNDVPQSTSFHVFKQAEINYEENSTIILKKVTSAPPTVPPSAPPTAPPTVPPTVPRTAPRAPDAFCTFKPLSSADAEEERLILDSIAWPETPPLPVPFLLTSDAAHSNFTILPGRGGGEQHVGDQLEVMIKMYDFQGNPKKSGGDAIVARLHNRALEAGVAGRVVDHLNGSYSAVFPLLWEGSAQVEVMLVHSSEAVTCLRRLNKDHPDRALFTSLFSSGSISATTSCHVCLRQTRLPQCNYTDLRTGDPWFCYKPEKLSCDARMNHRRTGYMNILKNDEKKLFQKNVNLKVFIPASGPANVTVLPQRKGQLGVDGGNGKSGLSGYYYQGVWRTLDGTKVYQFNDSSAISQCLKGKSVHVYGDSTVRQWFEYFRDSLPDAVPVNVNSVKVAGPFMIWDNVNNIMVTYRIHGLPYHIPIMPSGRVSYIANELETLVGGANTVVILGIWAHMSPFPFQLYIRRLQSIRRAVVRLLYRAPGTLVVIRTGALQHIGNVVSNGDWFTFQLNKVLRAIFKGLNVQLVDAWDMVLAHHLPHDLHPKPPIIKNMIDVLLSHTCPQKKS